MLNRLNYLLNPLHHSNPSPMFAHGFGTNFEDLTCDYITWLHHYGYDTVIYYSNHGKSERDTNFMERITNNINYHKEYILEEYMNTKVISSPQEYDPSIVTHFLPPDDVLLLEQIINHCNTHHNPKKYKPILVVHNIETISLELIDKLIQYGKAIVSGDCSQLLTHTTLRQRGSYLLTENLPQWDLQVPNILKR